MAHKVDSPEDLHAAAKDFIAAAASAGIIGPHTASALEAYADNLHASAATTTPVESSSATQFVTPAATSKAPTTTPVAPVPTDRTQPEVRVGDPSGSAPPRPRPVAPQTRPQPAPSPPPPPAQRPSTRPLQPASIPVPPAPTGPTWTERAGSSLRAAWSRLSADFAANSLIYLGVLLSVVVIFVFFAFGYFGEAVANPGWRSPIFLAAPLIFFGLAWILRNKTGVPAAANAVGLIGALILPIMLSALFQDDSSWGHYWGDGANDPARSAQAGSLARFFPLSWIPNLDGSARWAGYAVVGLMCAVIYYVLARRHRIYAYGVAPMVWAAIGALGLFWAAGTSGLQMLTVLAAIAVGLIAAIAARETAIGQTIAYQTIRIGVVAAPVVFVLSLVLAYDDAVSEGARSPTLVDLAYPGAAAAALLAIVFAVASTTGFAWKDLGDRTLSAMASGLRIGAYVAAGAAVILAMSSAADPGWIGCGLVGYGIAAALIDRWLGGTQSVVTWLSRGAVVLGAALSLLNPMATTVTWAVIALLAMARSVSPTLRSATSIVLPYGDSPEEANAELWTPVFVLMGLGISRLVDIEYVTWTFLAAAAIAVGFRLLPERFSPLRSFASIPAAVFVVAAVGVALYVHSNLAAYSLTEVAAGLLAIAAICAAMNFAWAIRLPLVVAASDGAIVAYLAEALDANTNDLALIAATVLAASGIVLVTLSLVRPLEQWAVPHSLVGHLALYAAVIAATPNADALLVALGAVIVVHGTEALVLDRTGIPAIDALTEEGEDWNWLKIVPPTVTIVAIAPFTILAAHKFAWFAEQPVRLAIPAAGLGIAYSGVAAVADRGVFRITALTLAVASAVTAVAVSSVQGDGIVLTIALVSASVTAVLTAIALAEPTISALAWASVYAALAVAASEAGVATAHLYRPSTAAAIAVMFGASTASFLANRAKADRMQPWFETAAAVATVTVAAGMFFALDNGAWLWLWAVTAAAASLAVAVAYRVGPMSALVWVYLLIAYLDVFGDAIVSNAAWLIPFAAAAAAVGAILPGRPSNEPTDPAVISTAVAALTIVGAIATGVVHGDPAAAMAWGALVMASIGAVRGEIAWLHGGVGLLIGAGVLEQGPWPTVSLATAAGVETGAAILRRSDHERLVLPWIAVGLWGATFGAAMEWAGLEAGAIVALALAVGTVASVAAVGALIAAPSTPWIRRWAPPVGVLGQIGLVVAAAQAIVAFREPDALLVWALIAWIEAAVIGVAATILTNRLGVWVSTFFIGVATVFTVAGLELPPATAVWALVVAGVCASTISLWRLSLGVEATTADLWVVPAGVLGQLGLAAAAVEAWLEFAESEALLTSAVIVTIEAVLVGTPATIKRWPAGVWLSTGLLGVGGALVLAGLRLDWLEAVWATAIIGGSLLTVWLVSIVGTDNDRIVLWRLPAAALAQVALAASAVAAARGLTETDAYLVWAVLAAIDAMAFGIVATTTASMWMAGLSTAMALGAIQLALQRQGAETAGAWIWLAMTMVLVAVATLVTRFRARPRALAWVPPLHASVLAASAIGLGWGTSVLAPRDVILLSAALVACVGADLMANRTWLDTLGLDGLPLGGIAFVLSAGLVAISLGPDDRWAMPTLLAIAVVGVAFAGVAGATTGQLRLSTAVMAVGFSTVGLVATAVLYPPISAELGWVLLVSGAASAAFALTARQPIAMHAAVIIWLVGALVLIEYHWTLELLATVTTVSAVLLVMLEVERVRRKRADEDVPDWSRIAEWVLMIAPMVLAAREMVTTSLVYGLLLGFEGALILGWGIISQVRRRAVVGLAGITTAILMAVMVPLVQGMGGTLTGGWWLVIGGALAVVFIATGSMLEKYRTRIGERLTRTTDILERWE